jgi:hypothetical protein
MKSSIPRWLFCLVAVLAVAILLPKGVRSLAEAASGESTDYYSTSGLTNSAIPLWNPTNSIPLSPDKAVIAAIKYANSKRQQPLSWDADSVELRKLSPESPWFYTVTLTDRKSGQYELEVVRITVIRLRGCSFAESI